MPKTIWQRMLPKGKYKEVKIDFNKLSVEWFAPHLYRKDAYALGCGRTALTTLTGVSPDMIPIGKGEKHHYSDRFMVNFLRQRDYQVLPVTQCDMTQHSDVILHEITEDHVVLFSQLMIKNEASWSVTYGGLVYHNFYVTRLHGMEFLNKPLLSAYVIFHPKWRMTNLVSAETIHEQ